MLLLRPRSVLLVLAAVAFVALAPVAAVRANDVDSGPEKGAKVAALKVYDCTGENKDKTVDYAALRKGKVTVYLLVNADKFDRPMNQFMKTLDKKIGDDFKDVYAVAVWLTDDEDKTRTFLPRVQTSVNYGNTALTSFKGKDGPKDWNVNSDAHLTVVVADKEGKVAAKFGYRTVNDTETPTVVKEIEKLVKKK